MTKSHADTLRRLFSQDKTDDEIGAVLNLHPRTIKRCRLNLGLRRERKDWLAFKEKLPAVHEQIRFRNPDGSRLTARHIAKKLGISAASVSTEARKIGMPFYKRRSSKYHFRVLEMPENKVVNYSASLQKFKERYDGLDWSSPEGQAICWINEYRNQNGPNRAKELGIE